MRRPRPGTRIALVLALWLTVLLTAIAGGFAYSMHTGAIAAGKRGRRRARARAAAGGAIERTVYELSDAARRRRAWTAQRQDARVPERRRDRADRARDRRDREDRPQQSARSRSPARAGLVTQHRRRRAGHRGCGAPGRRGDRPARWRSDFRGRAAPSRSRTTARRARSRACRERAGSRRSARVARVLGTDTPGGLLSRIARQRHRACTPGRPSTCFTASRERAARAAERRRRRPIDAYVAHARRSAVRERAAGAAVSRAPRDSASGAIRRRGGSAPKRGLVPMV